MIRAQSGGASFANNYAELKRALFENGMGNMERLLYTLTPTNRPIPHYVSVIYCLNESAEWKNVLTCPESYNFDRCPASTNGVNDSYQVFFWADSPLLINMDIPLLKFLSYNSVLWYIYVVRLIIYIIDRINISRSIVQASNKCKEIVTCI